MKKYFSSNDTCLVIAACFSLVSLFLGNVFLPSVDAQVPLVVMTMNSLTFKYVLVMEITGSGLILLQLLVDSIASKRGLFSSRDAILNFGILMIILISSITIFYFAVEYRRYWTLQSFNHVRLVCFVSLICWFASYYGANVWKLHRLAILILCLGTGLLLRLLDAVLTIEGGHLVTASVMLVSFSLVGFAIMCFRWWWFLRQKWLSNSTISNDELKCTMYCTLLLVMVIFMYLCTNIVTKATTIEEYTVFQLVTYEISFMGVFVVAFVYRTHMVRREAVKYEAELDFKRMFVRYISHEVRTPLNTVMMGLQLLSEGLDDSKDEETIETVKEIRKSSGIAVNVLNELLTFDKLEGGTLLLEKTDVRIVHLIEDAVIPFQIQAQQAKITLSVVRDHLSSDILDSLHLNVDGNKMAQVIRNLVSNGLKFTPADGVVVVRISAVDAEVDEEGVYTCILKVTVTDTGAGISEENQKRLFKQVVQFNPGKLQNGGGSGLGLYISHGIVELHGGKLQVSSLGEGQGCTFTLSLPTGRQGRRPSATRRKRGFLRPREFAGHSYSGRSVSSLRQRVENFTVVHQQHSYGSNLYFPHSSRHLFHNAPISPEETVSTPVTHPVTARVAAPVTAAAVLRIFEEGEEGENDVNVSDRGPAEEVNGDVANVEVFVEDAVINSAKRMHVLVVDDAGASRKMQCRLLRRRCKSCIEAENGQQAVDIVTNSLKGDGERIHLILMDSMMPVLNGLDATKEIRAMNFRGGIIGLTGNVSTEDITTFLAHGADAVLPKPLDILSFDAAVERLFKTRMRHVMGDIPGH